MLEKRKVNFLRRFKSIKNKRNEIILARSRRDQEFRPDVLGGRAIRPLCEHFWQPWDTLHVLFFVVSTLTHITLFK